jgi:hypothetical protein
MIAAESSAPMSCSAATAAAATAATAVLKTGRPFFIPRVHFDFEFGKTEITICRRQFPGPLRLCYHALTINESQCGCLDSADLDKMSQWKWFFALAAPLLSSESSDQEKQLLTSFQ